MSPILRDKIRTLVCEDPGGCPPSRRLITCRAIFTRSPRSRRINNNNISCSNSSGNSSSNRNRISCRPTRTIINHRLWLPLPPLLPPSLLPPRPVPFSTTFKRRNLNLLLWRRNFRPRRQPRRPSPRMSRRQRRFRRRRRRWRLRLPSGNLFLRYPLPPHLPLCPLRRSRSLPPQFILVICHRATTSRRTRSFVMRWVGFIRRQISDTVNGGP